MMLGTLLMLTGTSVCGIILLYIVKPVIFIEILTSLLRLKIGLKVKYVTSNGKRYCYSEKGTAAKHESTMLFLHGFTSSKDAWNIIAEHIKATHIILFDFPGHGDSDIPNDPDDVTVWRLKDCLTEFIKAADLERQSLHLVGSSLGSTVGALYASDNPHHVKLLSLASPAMNTPVETDFFRDMARGECPMLTKSPEELDALMTLTMHNKPKLPKQILKGYWQLREKRIHFHTKLVMSASKALDDQTNICENYFTRIQTPTQVIWGKNDQVVDVSGVDLVKQYVPSVHSVHVLDQCGHTITIDQPLKLAGLLREFRQQIAQTS